MWISLKRPKAYCDTIFNGKMFLRATDRSRRRIVLISHDAHVGWRALVGLERVEVSVTRWLDCCSIFGHLQQWKFAQWNKIAKVDSKLLVARKIRGQCYKTLITSCQQPKELIFAIFVVIYFWFISRDNILKQHFTQKLFDANTTRLLCFNMGQFKNLILKNRIGSMVSQLENWFTHS